VTASLPASCAAAAGYFGLFDAGRPPDVPAAASVTVPEIAALLSHDAYMGAWFFDEGDLAGLTPPSIPPPRRWIETAARALASTPARRTVAAMARHMAMWHSLAGEPSSASVMAAAARMTELDFASSPLVHVMLANHAPRPARDPRWLLGDAGTRRSFRDGFLGSVERPRGRAMAELDLTVASFVLLLEHFTSLPTDRRPPEREVQDLAHVVGRSVASHLSRTRGRDLDRLPDIVERALGPHRDAAAGLHAGLLEYVAYFCRRCPVGCLVSPALGTAGAFWSDLHPLARMP